MLSENYILNGREITRESYSYGCGSLRDNVLLSTLKGEHILFGEEDVLIIPLEIYDRDKCYMIHYTIADLRTSLKNDETALLSDLSLENIWITYRATIESDTWKR